MPTRFFIHYAKFIIHSSPPKVVAMTGRRRAMTGWKPIPLWSSWERPGRFR